MGTATAPATAAAKAAPAPSAATAAAKAAAAKAVAGAAPPAEAAAGTAEDKASAVFRAYDVDGKSWLDRADMMSAFAELGVLHGLNAKTLGEVIGMDKSLQAKDKRFTLAEFMQAYDKLHRYFNTGKQLNPSKKEDDEVNMGSKGDEAALTQCFNNYCRYTVGQGRLTEQQQAGDLKMNSAQFSKLACDLGVVEPHGPLPQAEVDIIFAKCKAPGTRRLTFPQFVRAVGSIGKDFNCSVGDLMAALGPQLKPRTSLVQPAPAPFLKKYKGKDIAPAVARRSSDTGALLAAALSKHDLLAPAPPSHAHSSELSPSPLSRELHTPSLTVPGMDDFTAQPPMVRNPRQSTTGGTLTKLSPLLSDTSGLEPPAWMQVVMERLNVAENEVKFLKNHQANAANQAASLTNHKVLEEKIKDMEHKMQTLDPHGISSGGSVEARFLADEERLKEQEAKLVAMTAKIETLRVQAMAPGGKGGHAAGGCNFGPNEASLLANADAKMAAVQIQVSQAEDIARAADKSVSAFQTQIRNLDQNVEKAEWKFQDVLQMLKTLHQMLKDLTESKDKALVDAMQATDQALLKMATDVREAMAASVAASAAAAEAHETISKVKDVEVVLGELHKQQAELYISVCGLQVASNKASVDGEGLNGRLNEMLAQVTDINQRAAVREEKSKADNDILAAVDERVKALANQVVDVQREAKETAGTVARVQSVAAAAPAEGLRALEAKVTELAASAALGDKSALDDMRMQVRVLKDEVAVVKARPAGGGGGGGDGGGVSNKALESFKDQMYEDMRDLDASLGKMDQGIKTFGATVEQLKNQVANANKDLDLRFTSYAKITDLREAENHVLDRHAQLHDEVENAKRNVREMSKGVEDNTEKVMVQFNKLASQYLGQATTFSQLQLQVGHMDSSVVKVDERIDGRAQALEAGIVRHLQSSNTAVEEAMKALETRLNTADSRVADTLHIAEKRLLDSDTQIRMALGQMDQHVAERFEMGDKVLMRLARQIDYLQKKLREAAEPNVQKNQRLPLPSGAQPADRPTRGGTEGIVPREPAGDNEDGAPRRHRRHHHHSRDETSAASTVLGNGH